VQNCTWTAWQELIPLIPYIKMHILLTVLHTFLMELKRGIGQNIKTSSPW